MIEETKQLTAEAQESMSYDSMFFIYPNFMKGQALEGLEDMADGQGGYVSDVDMKVLSSNNWTPLPLGDSHQYAMYDFDGLNKIRLAKESLIAKGLIDIVGDGCAADVKLEDMVYNGFAIVTKRGINKIQNLFTERKTNDTN